MVVFKTVEEYREYEADQSKTEYEKVLESQHYFYIKYFVIEGVGLEAKIRHGEVLETLKRHENDQVGTFYTNLRRSLNR